MAWRTPDEDDLVATLSLKEVDTFRRSAGVSYDPVARLLTRTTAMVRGHIASGGKCRLSPDETTLPESCISRAMDYAAFDVLKRIGMNVNESREKARTSAEEFFRRIEEGRFVPESHGAGESDTTSGPAVQVVVSSRHRMMAAKMEGL